MQKIVRPGTLRTYGGGHVSVYLNINTERGYMSFTGVIGPTLSGNAYGGCGQIAMEFKHRHAKDDDSRYTNPTRPEEFNFAPEWNAKLWYDVLDAWKAWHMKKVNDVPQDVLHWLATLPDTDRQPAWV